jgi:hypothetical protein
VTEVGEHLRNLRERGFSLLAPLTPEQIAEANAWLLSRPVFIDVHVPVHAANRGIKIAPRQNAGHVECLCVSTDDAILTPHVFERALGLTDLAAAWLGRDPPVLYSSNCFWTRPGPTKTRWDIQEFHRDQDDSRFLPMFVYLSDVLEEADGPQELIGPDGETRAVYGPAGTVFLSDTMLQHRGRKPTSRERGIAWMRWGISDRPAANAWDRIEPIARERMGDRYPSDPRLRESIKLLVA